jgi:hypothetical protein
MNGERIYSIGFIATLLGRAPADIAAALDASGVRAVVFLNDVPHFAYAAIQAARLYFDRSSDGENINQG